MVKNFLSFTVNCEPLLSVMMQLSYAGVCISMPLPSSYRWRAGLTKYAAVKTTDGNRNFEGVADGTNKRNSPPKFEGRLAGPMRVFAETEPSGVSI